jgi:hypothetical protein
MDQRRYKKYLTLSTTAMVRPQSVHSSPGVKDKQHQEDVDSIHLYTHIIYAHHYRRLMNNTSSPTVG